MSGGCTDQVHWPDLKPASPDVVCTVGGSLCHRPESWEGIKGRFSGPITGGALFLFLVGILMVSW